MISKGFFKSSLLFTAGGALPMLSSFLLLPFYTNFLSDINYLQLLFYISVSTLSQILFSLATDTYFGVKYSQLFAEEESQKDFITFISRFLLRAGIVLLVLFAFTGNWIFDLVFTESEASFWPWGFVSIITGFFNSYFKTASICLIYLKRPGKFLLDNVLNFILTLTISLGGLYIFPDSVVGPMLGRFISGVVIFLLGARIFSVSGSGRSNPRFRAEMIAFCAPYLAYGIALWVLSYVDRYILKNNVDVTELNAYDLVLKCFLGVEFFQNSLNAVIFPRVYDIYARTGGTGTSVQSNRYFNVFTILNTIGLIIFCIALPWLYQLLISKPHFYQGTVYIGIIAAGYSCRSVVSFYLSGILFARRMKLMLVIFGISAAAQLVLALVAIKHFGLAGALYAGLVTRVLQAALFAILAPKAFNYSFNALKIFVLPGLYLFSNLVQFAVTDDYHIEYYLIQLVVFCILAVALFRKEILQLRLGNASS